MNNYISKLLICLIFFTADTNISLSENVNFTLTQSADLSGKEFKNYKLGCGDNKFQNGNREAESVLNIFYSYNARITGGKFECSLQNVIYARSNENLIISSVTASKGSDNAIEIRDSFALIKHSEFSESPQNKCIESENGIVIFYNNIIRDCLNGFDIEKTDYNNYAAAIFLSNTFIAIENDAYNCHDRISSEGNNVYLFLKDNNYQKRGKDFRIFGKKKTCKNTFQISDELENAVLTENFMAIKKFVEEIINQTSH